MSADAKLRNQAAASDLHVLLARIEKQKIAIDKLQITSAAAVADLARVAAELAAIRQRLAALESPPVAPAP